MRKCGILAALVNTLHLKTELDGNKLRDNNVLNRNGEARLVGWSRQMLYPGFNILPRSVFWSASLNGRSDNTDANRAFRIDTSGVRTVHS